MAFGNYNNPTVNTKKDSSPTTYSNVRFSNPESAIDPSSITFSYWKGLLRLEITPMKKNADDSYNYDRDNSVSVFFSPTKAFMFYQQMLAFRQNPDAYMNIGINTKSAVIYLTNGVNEFGEANKGIFLVVKTVNEHGEITSAIAYQFKTTSNDYYGIVNYAGGSNFSKNFDFTTTLEMDMLIRVFDNYLDAIGGAYAATVVDATRFTSNSIIGRVNAIHDKLGIEYTGGSKKHTSNASSFFNNNGNDGYSLPESATNSSKIEEYDNYDSLADDLM